MANLLPQSYMANLQEIDTWNEVHQRYLHLNLNVMLLDHQLGKLVHGCSQRDASQVFFLIRTVQYLKKDVDSMKQSLRELLIGLFQSKSSADIRSLEGLILEQEVYELLSQMKSDELKSFMAKIDVFTKFVDDKSMEARGMKVELDRMQENLNLADMNLGQSGEGKTQIPQQQGFNQASHTGNTEKCLSDIIVVMYGFPRDVALDIQKSLLTSRKLVSQAFKMKNRSTFLDDLNGKREDFDPMGFLDNEVISANCEPDQDGETLHWENVCIAKKNSEDLVKDLVKEEIKNVDINCLKNEILKVTRDFVFHLETVLCDLVFIVYDMMSGYKPAMTKFQKFKSALREDMKKKQNWTAPIIVYKVFAMLKVPCQGAESDKEALCKEIEFDRVINTFHKVFTLLGTVLKKTTLSSQTILNMRFIVGCQTLLIHAEKLTKEIALKIYGVKTR